MMTFLELGKYGRLGNQLFQVASTIGIAYKNEHLTGFPEWEHPFINSPNTLEGEKFETQEVPWGYHDIIVPKGKNISLQGYLQSEKYFKNIEFYIRDLFTFKTVPDLRHYIKHGNFIAVHVRRGDYDGKHHTILGSDYYREAISNLPDIPIMLFSDDMEEAKKVVPWHTNTFHIDPGQDMAMMTQAKFHVIANSSFSWWGAWLSNSEKVIAPGNWFGPRLEHWSTKDLIPKTWEVI